MAFEPARLVIDYGVRDLCKRPYPNHKKGCPNYGNRDSCPPARARIEDSINLDIVTYVIWTTFNFRGHVNRMREKHPEWSQRRLECCLYWQQRAKKVLRQEIIRFKLLHKNYECIHIPEACGVNVTATMKNIGVELEWPPKILTYQVAVAGVLK